MSARTRAYFVADVHLGLRSADPAEREERFLSFLRGIREDAASLYLLGDIWDFWFEYRDVVPREAGRVTAELASLAASGTDVCFVPGNHDIWTYSYLESLGIRRCEQPLFETIAGKRLCLGHGDRLGGSRPGYGFLLKLFHSRFCQALFSTLHPWVAYRLATAWSGSNRKSHKPYHFRGEKEPLWQYALTQKADIFIFGHFHDSFDAVLPTGARFIVLKDWISGGTPHAVIDVESGLLEIKG